jgi:hypothetical protein
MWKDRRKVLKILKERRWLRFLNGKAVVIQSGYRGMKGRMRACDRRDEYVVVNCHISLLMVCSD